MKRTIIVTILSFISVACYLTGFFLLVSKERINFVLKGEENIIINLNQKYEEPGYEFNICKRKKCHNYNSEVTIVNNINPTKIGDYKIIYKIEYQGEEQELTRNIKIQDTVAPTIILKGEQEISICPNSTYVEDGYTSNDNYDGDLTKEVKEKILDDKKVYTVEDSSNNKAEIERIIKKEDTEAPVIKLKGSTKINLSINEEYKEKGYTIKDNCDQDITDKVQIESNVDTSMEGTYEVKYTITDKSGNKNTTKRTVVVTRPIIFTSTKAKDYENELINYIKNKNYQVSIGYVNLNNGNTFYYQPNKVYFGASLVKTVDALYIYEKTTPTDSTKKLVKKAISVSDNNAHLKLVNQIGLDNLRAYGKSLGANRFLTSKTNLYYGETTVMDQIAIWKHLYSFINKNASGNELKEYFINSYFNFLLFDGIPTTMHKYGYAQQYYHEAGIVFSKKPYIVVILTRHGEGDYKGIIKDLSQKIYEYNKIDN